MATRLSFLACIALVSNAGTAPGALPSSQPAIDRRAALWGALGTYDSLPRGQDGRADHDRLLRELKDLGANTYNWLVWHADTDWEDLQRFLPLARAARIRVWVTLVPPSESPPRTKRYSEPYRLDYEKWALEIAQLSLREPTLVAWSIDDFVHNLDFYTPAKLAAMLNAAHDVNPRLAFVPCVYYRQVNAGFAEKYRGLLDGILFPYRNESVRADLKDATHVADEVKRIRAMMGADLPVLVDVYATAHSKLGDSSPEYVRDVIRSGRESADGVLIYCHQDPERQAAKYRVIREEFRGVPRIPALSGQPWQIAGDPDLGEFTSPRQQPVDFAVWQAGDGSWQLWSCIRNTKCGGVTRLFHRWEGLRLPDHDWKPVGIAMQADPQYGERPGGLQAPYVTRVDDLYHLFYGDWVNICLARSRDGKRFERWTYDSRDQPARGEALSHSPRTGMFSEGPDANARDPMVLRIGGRWHCYYTAHPGGVGAVYCRTSTDLRAWSESRVVARGGRAGSGPNAAECPFVVQLDGWFYLFRTQRYGRDAVTSVYRSRDPLDFGIDSDACFVCELPVAAPEILQHEGTWYVAYLSPSLKGIQISRLQWEKSDAVEPAN